MQLHSASVPRRRRDPPEEAPLRLLHTHTLTHRHLFRVWRRWPAQMAPVSASRYRVFQRAITEFLFYCLSVLTTGFRREKKKSILRGSYRVLPASTGFSSRFTGFQGVSWDCRCLYRVLPSFPAKGWPWEWRNNDENPKTR